MKRSLTSFRLGLPRSVKFQRDIEKMIGRPLPDASIDGRAACAGNCVQAAAGRGWPLMLEKMIFGRFIPGTFVCS